MDGDEYEKKTPTRLSAGRYEKRKRPTTSSFVITTPQRYVKKSKKTDSKSITTLTPIDLTSTSSSSTPRKLSQVLYTPSMTLTPSSIVYNQELSNDDNTLPSSMQLFYEDEALMSKYQSQSTFILSNPNFLMGDNSIKILPNMTPPSDILPSYLFKMSIMSPLDTTKSDKEQRRSVKTVLFPSTKENQYQSLESPSSESLESMERRGSYTPNTYEALDRFKKMANSSNYSMSPSSSEYSVNTSSPTYLEAVEEVMKIFEHQYSSSSSQSSPYSPYVAPSLINRNDSPFTIFEDSPTSLSGMYKKQQQITPPSPYYNTLRSLSDIQETSFTIPPASPIVVSTTKIPLRRTKRASSPMLRRKQSAPYYDIKTKKDETFSSSMNKYPNNNLPIMIKPTSGTVNDMGFLPEFPTFEKFIACEYDYYFYNRPWYLPGFGHSVGSFKKPILFNDMPKNPIPLSKRNNDNVHLVKIFVMESIKEKLRREKSKYLSEIGLTSESFKKYVSNSFPGVDPNEFLSPIKKASAFATTKKALDKIYSNKIDDLMKTYDLRESISLVQSSISNINAQVDIVDTLPQPANVQSSNTSIKKPSFLNSTCIAFTDCLKISLTFNDSQPKKMSGNMENNSFEFKLLCTDPDDNGSETWGIKVPKSAIEISLKNMTTMETFNFIEMGKGIIMRNATITSNSDPKLTVNGDIFKKSSSKIEFIDSEWTSKLKKTSNYENHMDYTEITNKDKDSLLSITGKEEPDKWIIVKYNLSTWGTNDDNALIFSFTLPYIPIQSTSIKSKIHGDRLWILEHQLILPEINDEKVGKNNEFLPINTKLMEKVWFNSNIGLCRKTLSIDFEKLYLNDYEGLSKHRIEPIKHITPGDSKLSLDSNDDNNDESNNNNNNNNNVSYARKRSYLKPNADNLSNMNESRTRIESLSFSSTTRLLTKQGDFISKDSNTCYTSITRQLISSIIHFTVLRDRDILNNANNNFIRALPIQSTLSIKTTDQSQYEHPLSGNASGLTLFSKSGVSIKKLDNIILSDESPEFITLNLNDSNIKCILKDFTITESNTIIRNSSQKLVTCLATLKIPRNSCNRVSIIMDTTASVKYAILTSPVYTTETELIEVSSFNNLIKKSTLVNDSNYLQMVYYNEILNGLSTDSPKALELRFDNLNWKQDEEFKYMYLKFFFTYQNRNNNGTMTS